MSPHDSNLQDERISRLYKMGSNGTPSAELDEHIKKAAHTAVTSQRLSPGWRYSATAAVLMLCIGVILEIFDITPPPPEELTTEPAMAPAQYSDSALPKMQEPVAGQSVEAKRKRIETDTTASRMITEQKKQELRTKSKLMDMQSSQVMPAKPALGLTPSVEEAFIEKESAEKAVTADAMEPDCTKFSYPETTDRAAWIDMANKLRAKGEFGHLNCLKKTFNKSFDPPLELE